MACSLTGKRVISRHASRMIIPEARCFLILGQLAMTEICHRFRALPAAARSLGRSIVVINHTGSSFCVSASG
jgi:hypothetical protein